VLVKEKGVGEGKGCWGRKRVLGHIWAKPGPDLGQISARSLASPNQPYQPWYARNITPPSENSCSHECSSFARFLLIVIPIFSAVCLNIAYEIRSKLSLSHRISLYRHSIIRRFYLDLFI